MCFCVQINHTRKELLFLMFLKINLRNYSSLHKLFYGLQKKQVLTTTSLVLMIITTVYGFGNVSVSYEQMTYAGIIWFVLAGICFFFPAGLMMADYGSAFHDAEGGIYSWLAGSIGEKWAFIGTFVWLANWVLWLVASASRY